MTTLNDADRLFPTDFNQFLIYKDYKGYDCRPCFDRVRFHTATMPLNVIEASFIGTVLEGVFYGKPYYIYDVPMLQFISSLGLYCIVFVLYIRVHKSKKCDDKNILIYPITSLFVLCTASFVLDFTQEYLTVVSKTSPT
jgi:Serpentine type 7TM GPCR chemoreceptor Srz